MAGGENRHSGKRPSFEEAFGQLQETVEVLEAGGLPLEEATRLLEKGMRLAKTCNEVLTSAELRISRLQRSFSEQMAMVEEPDAVETEQEEAE